MPDKRAQQAGGGARAFLEPKPGSGPQGSWSSEEPCYVRRRGVVEKEGCDGIREAYRGHMDKCKVFGFYSQ